MRFLISGGLTAIFVSSAMAASLQAVTPIKAPFVESNLHLDEMITGVHVSATVHAEWLRNRKRLETCGKCAMTQRFPRED